MPNLKILVVILSVVAGCDGTPVEFNNCMVIHGAKECEVVARFKDVYNCERYKIFWNMGVNSDLLVATGTATATYKAPKISDESWCK